MQLTINWRRHIVGETDWQAALEQWLRPNLLAVLIRIVPVFTIGGVTTEGRTTFVVRDLQKKSLLNLVSI